jgi:hypothetical protein
MSLAAARWLRPGWLAERAAPNVPAGAGPVAARIIHRGAPGGGA